MKIDGPEDVFVARAVADEGEVLDALVQKHRNKHAALILM